MSKSVARWLELLQTWIFNDYINYLCLQILIVCRMMVFRMCIDYFVYYVNHKFQHYAQGLPFVPTMSWKLRITFSGKSLDPWFLSFKNFSILKILFPYGPGGLPIVLTVCWCFEFAFMFFLILFFFKPARPTGGHADRIVRVLVHRIHIYNYIFCFEISIVRVIIIMV